MGILSNDIKEDNYYEEGKYKLALRLCFLFSGLFAVLSIIESFNSVRNTMIYILCAVIPIAELIYLHKTKKYKIVYLTLCLIGSLMAFYTLNFFIEEIHYGDFLWMVLIIILAYWGLEIKYGVLFLVLNLITLIYYFTFSINQNLTSLREINTVTSISLGIEVAIAFVAISTIIHQFIRFYRYSYESLLKNKIELEKSNQLITAKNEENVILMKEVHHRVKNNLQIIISLLRLQKNNLPPEAEQKFEEAISRIMTMSLIHRKLYQSSDLTKINLESYINDLIKEILASLSTNENITTNIQTNYNSIGLRTIVPLGLILNELLSNSFKYAFDNKLGKINIEIIAIKQNEFELKYSDSGTWKEASENKVNFGLELIETLTEQLEGTCYRENSNYIFKLKNLDI